MARPGGPCDIYAAAGTPCAAAHSTTRALYAAYNGPLYQVKRLSDNKTLNIGVDGGYARADMQDAFCVHTTCVISLIYDQSGKGNHLYQGAPGTFKGPAPGAFDTQPIADAAPITIASHKAYGVFIMPGMGFRNNNATGIAIDDDPEGIYYVVDGKHYDSGCCFDYGNSSTNGRAVGTGTMETTYFGTATAWGSGNGAGPWIMADMEAGLFSGYNAKQNAADPTIDSWRFVTAVVDGGGGNKWDLRGGDAQQGGLTTFYSGTRPGSTANSSYYPMHKQGAILLGTGGDNGNGSSGTFFEGVITTGYPSETTTDAVQANIVSARYDVQRVSLSRIATFTPDSTHEVSETFTNTTGAAASGVRLTVSVPAGWIAQAAGKGSATFSDPVRPGMSVSATFTVTAGSKAGAGFVTGKAEWTSPATHGSQFETIQARVRNAQPVKINEVRFGTGVSPTNQFIELYNASARPVDISRWTLIATSSQRAPVPLAAIPADTILPGKAFYLLGLSGSGLTAPAGRGATRINLRSVTGFGEGQKIEIDTGSAKEIRTVVSVGTEAAAMTTLFVPVSTGPWITIPAGSTNVPVSNATGFVVGQNIGIDPGGKGEVATVTQVGKAATQTTFSMAASAGATTIRVAAGSDITSGDMLTLGTGAHRELAKVVSAGSANATGTGIDLAAPLRFEHRAGIDVSDAGTGISFSPATKFPHISGDSLQALGSGIVLDKPLLNSHAYGAPLANSPVTTPGYTGPKPDQWFGSALSSTAGSIALTDAGGVLVVDAIVYGSQQSNSSANGTIASPEIATPEGEQGKGGCIVALPGAAAGATDRSVGRFPDGFDTDSNCMDFHIQPATSLSAASAAGGANIKVASVAGFDAGQTIMIDSGNSLETAVIAAVGTAGATTVATSSAVGAKVIAVAGAAGFSAGQTITIDDGANRESAVIVSTTGGRGGRGGRGGGSTITVAAPLTVAHPDGAQISGSGITLAAPLTRAHGVGAQTSLSLPTPGAANKYP